MVFVRSFANGIKRLVVLSFLCLKAQEQPFDGQATCSKLRRFEGYEILRARLLNKVPKYGNDVEWVDAIGVKWARYINKLEDWDSIMQIMVLPYLRNVAAIARFISGIYPEVHYELLNYNPLASAKYHLIEREFCFKENPKRFTKAQMEHFAEIANSNGVKNILIDE